MFLLSLLVFVLTAAFNSTALAAPVRTTKIVELTITPNVSGGGCTTSHDSYITIGACINTSGGNNVNGDAYITATSRVTACGAHLYLYNNNGDLFANGDYSCYSGKKTHVGSITTWQPFGGTYHTYVEVNYAVGSYNGNYSQTSPWLTL